MKFRHMLPAIALAIAPSFVSAEDLTIGSILSLTGPYAFVGKSAKLGMELAVEEVNASKSLGGDRKFKMAVEDDGSNNNQAITLLTKFATGDAIAIAGPTGSAQTTASSPAANQHKIAMLGIAVSTAVNKAGRWSNRMLNSPATLMEALSEYVYKRYKPKTVMTVASRDNDGAAAQSVVVRKWFEGKAKLLPEESALMADTDFSALATKIASLKPNVVFITMNDSAAANIILQSRQAGVGKEVQFIGNNGAANLTFLKIGGKAVEGTVMATDALPGIRRDALAKNYMANFKKKFGSEPDQFAAVGYTIVQLYAHAVAGIKGKVTREAVLAGLVSTNNLPVVLGDGKTGFKFDADRNPTYTPIIIVAKGGKLVPVP